MQTAFITGPTGQDGSYLVESLLDEGWHVHALVRSRIGVDETELDDRVVQHVGDLAAQDELRDIVRSVSPDLIINLGGISSVAQSWEHPVETSRITGLSVAALLDASWSLHDEGLPVRFVQASSSEIFGAAQESPQSEQTIISPVSPYGAAKAYAHHLTGVYRARGMFAASAILFNHESPRRPRSFVTRKISLGVAMIAAGKEGTLALGNLGAARDWGWAPDYVDAIRRIALADEPDDFVVATGQVHTVRDFVAAAFATAGIEDWSRHVRIDDRYNRPIDTPTMCGDSRRIRERLGWSPTVDFEGIVRAMVMHDVEAIASDEQA